MPLPHFLWKGEMMRWKARPQKKKAPNVRRVFLFLPAKLPIDPRPGYIDYNSKQWRWLEFATIATDNDGGWYWWIDERRDNG